jgi:hypothetical protein
MEWQATGAFRSLDDDVSTNGDESGKDRYIRRSGDESLIGSDNIHYGTWIGGRDLRGLGALLKNACNKHMSIYIGVTTFVTGFREKGSDL